MTPRVILYARVSTDKQSHDSQLTELREYCTRRGWPEPVAFLDKVSGAKFSREGLDAMMAAVRSGKVDILVVFRLDRLGRSLAHLVQIIAELTANKVALIVPGQGIDTSSSNPASQLQLNILAAIAEFERSIIRERVMAGLKAARANGVKFGRKEKLSKHRAAVLELKAQGKGPRGIARELGLPVSSVAKLMKQQA